MRSIPAARGGDTASRLFRETRPGSRSLRPADAKNRSPALPDSCSAHCLPAGLCVLPPQGCYFTFFTTSAVRAKRPMALGMTIRLLNISDSSHTRSLEARVPRKTNTRAISV